MKKRLRQWSKQRLQNEGFALFDLSVRPDGRLYRYLSQYNGRVIEDELYLLKVEIQPSRIIDRF